ncbi:MULTISPECIES: hypothetical protein [unclassified Haloferax]|uniref:DUF7286 family protein n=1 Tax=unclassified Haloferax TaxID=2625095 RepID=UPI002875F89E|nr:MULTISPECIES: hypothetical protein [unclassified Haloferax]MDS0240642.1 hypothetical protein [Haloferax sp. S2CR25]MDS0443763.1 hypothetical protein [Haloferax sp. S2CR25-2]
MVAVRLADDDRGRVPFALLGVLLLVGSATFSGALAGHDPVADRRVDDAMDRATAQSDAAIRAAVGDAARAAAANPVTSPANTTVGRLLSDERPFRDYLRLRIALAATERLRAVSVARGDVNATATLPRPTNESTLRDAMDRVSISSRENGTVLVATVENVSVEVARGGRTVAAESVTATVGVRTPVLALHDRTEAFERRLDANALDGGTLDATVTTAMWASAWTRGWSQYAGAPVDNVVSNDHAALATNAGVLLAEQQAFGATDADGRGATGRAAVQVGAQSLLSQTGVPAAPELANALPAPNPAAESAASEIPTNRTINASVGSAADHALVGFLDGRGDAPAYDDVVADAHRAAVEIETETDVLSRTEDPPENSGRGWTLVSISTDTSSSAETVPTRTPAVEADTVVVDAGSRIVTTVETTTRTFRRGNETLQTEARTETRTRVDLAAVVDPAAVSAPVRPIDPASTPGGALDGENFAAAADAAADMVVSRGGFDDIACDVATGDPPEPRQATAPAADGLDRWVRADLVALADRVRDRRVTASARRVAAGEVNLAAELAADLRADRRDLVGAPTAYDGVADRTRVAVRATYLDRVLATLDRRANQTAAASDAADNASRDADLGSLSEAVRAEEVARAALGDSRADGANGTGNESGVRFVPDADPMYLSLGGLDGASVPTVARGGTYHPLVARNTNLFTLPYGDAADTVLEPVFGSNRRVPLRVAARTLLAADSTLENTNGTNETLADRRDRLETAVDRSVVPAETAARHTLRDHTNHSVTERQRILERSLGAWDDPAHRALAITNGSAARAIAVEAAAPGTVEADLLERRLDVAFRTVRRDRSTTVPQRLTNRTVETTRTARQQAVADVATDAAMNATEDAVADRLNDTLDSRFDTPFKRVPAGMPVAPVPGSWYATVNVWDVAVAGEFAQFRVHARGDTESLTYARDGSPVALDWDGDGVAETVGRGDRVSFEVRTPIVVAVPPSGVGVGDIDGNADERSEGWQGGPGCTVAADCPPEE